ncbi:MAG TPA: helix-turn-helix domain-containing protein, partial [Candidatus Glassbacteria bacterium]|nr:helix-turn-helix domain-containing protein [Candidatus Glassbacteria bacterium]
IEVHLPPLRERAEDLPELARHLLRRISGEREPEIAQEVIERLGGHDWPGNVRELAHALEQAWVIGHGRLDASAFDRLAGQSGAEPVPSGRFRRAVDHTERELLSQALANFPDNKTRAARSIGMKPSTFRDKLRKHGFE